ncbi:hypothetical protein IWX90DRAFT_76777 [Phyllosticta citrichinensis]|uniref:Uncharacterized protein n=1 Tax=Phyllosticta citrichinensis TaxID=1130410 RepID=A0ABR1XGV0_9PEZI
MHRAIIILITSASQRRTTRKRTSSFTVPPVDEKPRGLGCVRSPYVLLYSTAMQRWSPCARSPERTSHGKDRLRRDLTPTCAANNHGPSRTDGDAFIVLRHDEQVIGQRKQSCYTSTQSLSTDEELAIPFHVLFTKSAVPASFSKRQRPHLASRGMMKPRVSLSKPDGKKSGHASLRLPAAPNSKMQFVSSQALLVCWIDVGCEYGPLIFEARPTISHSVFFCSVCAHFCRG